MRCAVEQVRILLSECSHRGRREWQAFRQTHIDIVRQNSAPRARSLIPSSAQTTGDVRLQRSISMPGNKNHSSSFPTCGYPAGNRPIENLPSASTPPDVGLSHSRPFRSFDAVCHRHPHNQPIETRCLKAKIPFTEVCSANKAVDHEGRGAIGKSIT